MEQMKVLKSVSEENIENGDATSTVLDTGFGGVEHSGLVEVWDAFLTRDVGVRPEAGVREVPRVKVEARTGYEARQEAQRRFSELGLVPVDATDICVRKIAA